MARVLSPISSPASKLFSFRPVIATRALPEDRLWQLLYQFHCCPLRQRQLALKSLCAHKLPPAPNQNLTIDVSEYRSEGFNTTGSRTASNSLGSYLATARHRAEEVAEECGLT